MTVPAYSKVILPLKALLEGEFFNEYIKKGEVVTVHPKMLQIVDFVTLLQSTDFHRQCPHAV
jgi:ribonuclease P/MRP protein subunit RPP40